MIQKNEFLEEALLKEQAKRELISNCEMRFSSWIYRFVRSHQELLDNGEYGFLYHAARDTLISRGFLTPRYPFYAFVSESSRSHSWCNSAKKFSMCSDANMLEFLYTYVVLL